MMARYMMVALTLVASLASPLQEAKAQSTGASDPIGRTIELMETASEKYARLSSPTERLQVATQMVGWIDYLLRETNPPAETAAQLNSMRTFWESRRGVDFSGGLQEVSAITGGLQRTPAGQARARALQQALDLIEALLVNMPPSMERHRADLTRIRDTVAAALHAQNSDASDEWTNAAVTPQVQESEEVDGDTPETTASELTRIPVGGADNSATVSNEAAAGRVKQGLSAIVTVMLGGAVFILLAGPLVSFVRWAFGKYIGLARMLWARYGVSFDGAATRNARHNAR